ncbi:MAG TPA: hypothetical protein VFN56_00695 [Candidatus Saccharimonadales bacterium]|nr:hypothetical protein [Candidatus Saccharimonadales bacterium]
MTEFTPRRAAEQSMQDYAQYKKDVDIRDSHIKGALHDQQRLEDNKAEVEKLNDDAYFKSLQEDAKRKGYKLDGDTREELQQNIANQQPYEQKSIDDHNKKARLYGRMSQEGDIQRAQEHVSEHPSEYFLAAMGDAAMHGVAVNIGSVEQQQASVEADQSRHQAA